jgi:uncharacterized membrane protein YfcA
MANKVNQSCEVDFVEFSVTFFALAIPAVIFAGISKGGFGSGAAFAATPLLALVLDPSVALGMMLPILMLADLATLRPFWKQWHVPSARFLILGGLPGVVLGASLYKVTNPDVLRFLIGAIALGFVGFQIARGRGWLKPPARALGTRAGLLAGLTAGFTSFVSHAGGPPAAIYLLAQGLSKTAFQATTVLTFWAINLFKAVPYAFLGIFTADTLKADVMLAPFVLFGVWIGVKAHRMLPETAFFAITYVLLTVTGSKLIWDTLT